MTDRYRGGRETRQDRKHAAVLLILGVCVKPSPQVSPSAGNIWPTCDQIWRGGRVCLSIFVFALMTYCKISCERQLPLRAFAGCLITPLDFASYFTEQTGRAVSVVQSITQRAKTSSAAEKKIEWNRSMKERGSRRRDEDNGALHPLIHEGRNEPLRTFRER